MSESEAENQSEHGYIYFVQAESGGPFKVGWTIDPERRLSEIQTGNPAPLTLLEKVRGTAQDEEELHQLLADFRGIGEWFAPFPQAVEIVREFTGRRSLLRDLKVGRSDDAFVCDMCHRFVYQSDGPTWWVSRSTQPVLTKALKRIQRMNADHARDLTDALAWWEKLIEELERQNTELADRISVAVGDATSAERKLLEDAANAIFAVEDQERAEEELASEFAARLHASRRGTSGVLESDVRLPSADESSPGGNHSPRARHVCRRCGAVVYGDAFYRHRENCEGAEDTS